MSQLFHTERGALGSIEQSTTSTCLRVGLITPVTADYLIGKNRVAG